MKEAIRKKILKIRSQLSEKEVIQKSQKIHQRLFFLNEFIESSNILFYKSIRNEVVTHKMIEESIQKGKKVFLPSIMKGKSDLEVYEIKHNAQLIEGEYKILEPDKSVSIKGDIKQLDLLIIPGVAFDLNGNRIGHGKGYYDNFLKNIPINIYKVAISFDFQILSKVPTTYHDEKVSKIITETRTIECL